MLNLYFKPLNKRSKKPVQAHSTDAGWDLFSTEEMIVYPNAQLKVSTGVAVQGKFTDPKDAEKELQAKYIPGFKLFQVTEGEEYIFYESFKSYIEEFASF